ncbi:MAG: histidine kinase [Actinomycetota bacterium]|nr:histidine kinase [Actinomycetota bacterium]
MVLLVVAVIGLIGVPYAFAVKHSDGVNAWLHALPHRLRRRGWGLLLVPVAVQYALIDGGDHLLGAVEVLAGVLAVIFVPRLAEKAVPYALLVLAGRGLLIAKSYHDGNNTEVLYGMVLAGAGESRTHFVPLQAAVFLAAGLWLLVRVQVPGGHQVSALVARWRDSARGGIHPGQGLLLLPVVALAIELLGTRNWFGVRWFTATAVVPLTVAVAVAASLVLVFRSWIWAATMAEAGLLVVGGYGLFIAAFWPAVPGYMYGFVMLDTPRAAILGSGLQGGALLAAGLWLAPRVMREHLPVPDPELAARTQQLSQRVQALTRTRYDAVDTAAAELRRIERDLHDGAQARLVAVGMSLQAAQRLFPASPEAALALVAEAKETSSRALTELRDLVRGIYPPVLADRGLADAIRALTLDTPLPVELAVDLPGEVELPVASAVYFSVAEALANVAKHAGARTVLISLSHGAGMLRAQITDDGAGGADPGLGTGLAGVERRLAAFDGILAVSSPPGGPTILVIEVPCALSSPKISSC